MPAIVTISKLFRTSMSHPSATTTTTTTMYGHCGQCTWLRLGFLWFGSFLWQCKLRLHEPGVQLWRPLRRSGPHGFAFSGVLSVNPPVHPLVRHVFGVCPATLPPAHVSRGGGEGGGRDETPAFSFCPFVFVCYVFACLFFLSFYVTCFHWFWGASISVTCIDMMHRCVVTQHHVVNFDLFVQGCHSLWPVDVYVCMCYVHRSALRYALVLCIMFPPIYMHGHLLSPLHVAVREGTPVAYVYTYVMFSMSSRHISYKHVH